MKTFVTTLLFFCLIWQAHAQNVITTQRTTDKIKIDGDYTDPDWENAPMVDGFIKWQPNAGDPASEDTEVKVLYDDDALYVLAKMYFKNRDSLAMELTQRDDIGNTDWFGMAIDPYANANDAFEFIVAITGVQFDARMTSNGEDQNWDAVWNSATKVYDDFWIAEVAIPYSAIRFANTPKQLWKANFMRSIANRNEKASWNQFDPTVQGFITQFGIIDGIENIKPPVRLSLLPYLSLYAQNFNDPSVDGSGSTGYSYNGGMDIKYGINDAFTLDMTLIPDFGQVRSDDVVLNLSPFEVRFDENRPFFTEGLELFNQDDLFYSRRVGGSPIGRWNVYGDLSETEEVIDNPGTSQLYNATKVSGRTSGGLGIGVFNAISKETSATILNNETGNRREAITSPFSNYNVVVLDQTLANNSSVSLSNASVWRQGNLFHKSNVTRTTFDLKNKAQSYGVNGGATLSQILNPDADNVLGYKYNLGLRKLSGNFTSSIGYEEISPDYDPTDLGFLWRNNQRWVGANVSYSMYNDFGPFQRGNFWGNINYRSVVEPAAYSSLGFNGGFWVQAKNNWNYNMWFNYNLDGNDYFEPRAFGRFLEVPSNFNTGIYVGTDHRKPFRIEVVGDVTTYGQEGRYETYFSVEPRMRFNNKFSVELEAELINSNNDVGFVNNDGGDIFMGIRDQKIVINELGLNYTFNDKMGLMGRVRHYWTSVAYDSYHMLGQQGELLNSEYDGFHDQSFNAFNVDLEYRWRFAPGSDIFVVWKNNISGGDNDQDINYRDLGYGSGLKDLSRLPQTNSLSVRLIYFLDYNSVF